MERARRERALQTKGVWEEEDAMRAQEGLQKGAIWHEGQREGSREERVQLKQKALEEADWASR